MSQPTLPVRYSPEPGIELYQFTDYTTSWAFIDAHITAEYQGKPTKFDNIYYCTSCNVVFILPSWFTDYYIGANVNPMQLLQKYIKCCKNPIIFIRIPEDQTNNLSPFKGMIFEPPQSPRIVWHVSEQWINTTIVVNALL